MSRNRNFARGAIAAGFWTIAVAPAAAATPRAMTALTAPVVLLSDLFDDAGPDAARVLGPSPSPGSRIVVDTPQLAAIARQFGVNWRPTSMTERVVLERAGRLLPREMIMPPLRAALLGVGAPTDAEIEIGGFAAPLVAPDARADVGIEQIDYDAASGRFAATVMVSGEADDIQRVRVSGQVAEFVDVPVPTHRLASGTIIEPGDLQMLHMPAPSARGDLVHTMEQAIGQELRRAAYPGLPIARADITRPTDVKKGARVTMELQAPGLTLSMQGIATEAGASGERITVLNTTSHVVVQADVVGRDRVRVVPGSLPVTAQGRLVAQLNTP